MLQLSLFANAYSLNDSRGTQTLILWWYGCFKSCWFPLLTFKIMQPFVLARGASRIRWKLFTDFQRLFRTKRDCWRCHFPCALFFFKTLLADLPTFDIWLEKKIWAIKISKSHRMKETKYFLYLHTDHSDLLCVQYKHFTNGLSTTLTMVTTSLLLSVILVVE